MPTTTPTVLDQISAEKLKIGERLARLDADRAKIATQLADLETAERVLTRVSRTPPGRRARSAATPRRQRPPPSLEAAGGRQEQPRASQWDANPARRASESAFWLWPPAGPDKNFTRRAPTIARTMSASPYSAISVADRSRSATASYMRHRWQPSSHKRLPDLGSRNQPTGPVPDTLEATELRSPAPEIATKSLNLRQQVCSHGPLRTFQTKCPGFCRVCREGRDQRAGRVGHEVARRDAFL